MNTRAATRWSPRVTLHRDYTTISVGMIDDYFAALALEHKDAVLARSRRIARTNLRVLDEWMQFSRPSGIYIDRHDMIYVADSESGSVGNGRSRTEKRGIRIGSVKDGKVIAFIPDPVEHATNTSAAEGVAADVNGVVYGAEVGPRALKRYEKM